MSGNCVGSGSASGMTPARKEPLEPGTFPIATDAVSVVGYSQQQQTKMLTIDTIQYSTATDAITLPLLTRDIQIIWQSGTVETVAVRRRDQLKVLAMWMTAREDLSWGRFANWATGDRNPAA